MSSFTNFSNVEERDRVVSGNRMVGVGWEIILGLKRYGYFLG